MKTRETISENSIKIKTPRLVFLAVSIVGVSLIGGGFFLLGKVEFFEDLCISIGFILTSSGLMSYIHSEYYKIYLDNPPGYLTIIESTFKQITTVKVPLDYYSHIIIHKSLQNGNSGKNRTGYEVELMSHAGTTLVIAEESIEDNALEFAKKIQNTTGMDIILNDLPVDFKRDPHTGGFTIDTGKQSTIKHIKKGVDSIITWKNTKNPLFYLFTLLLMYGLFHLVHFAFAPHIHNSLVVYFIYGTAGFLSVVIVISLLFNLAGTTYLLVSPDSISTFTALLGKRFRKREILKNDIGLIRNPVSTRARNFMVISKSGLMLARKIINTVSIDIKDIPGIVNLKNEIIVVPVSSLTINEKLFIEREIARTILR